MNKIKEFFKKLFDKKESTSKATEPSPTEPVDHLKHGTLKERLATVKTTRWVRFGIVSLIFFGWVAWLGSWWVLIFWFLLADIYLTQFIPWNWWKNLKNKSARTAMAWVDSIVYALVLVYFLFLFVGQNYQIPSSSLEKTLLTGDYLWVNKIIYGPRVPNTPLHFPLAQNTLFGCKSYSEWPQWDYHRLKGWRNVERYDIVVFNFPAGDTVALNVPNPDYYSAARHISIQYAQQTNTPIDNNYGRKYIKSHPDKFGKVIWRPVDRRDAYVKRCVGLPGETLKIVDGTIYVDGEALKEPQNMQFNYVVNTSQPIPDRDFDELDISQEGRNMQQIHKQGEHLYVLPLTKASFEALSNKPYVTDIERKTDDSQESSVIYPLDGQHKWTHNNYGPVWIPKKGESIDLNLDNLPLYERCIKNYEGNQLEVKNGTILINGKEADSYTFKMDYYWMMGDNRDNSSDSRFWGFVPEDHIIGSPMFVLISFDSDRSLFNGFVRWNRIFKDANPDK